MNTRLPRRWGFAVLLGLLCTLPVVTSGILQAEQSDATPPAATTTPAPPADSSTTTSTAKTSPGSKAPVQKPVLTPEQQAQITQIDTQLQQDLAKLQQVVDAHLAQVQQLLRDPQASDEAIKTALYQYTIARTDIQLAHILAKRAKARIVTPNPAPSAPVANPGTGTAQAGAKQAGAKASSGGGCTGCGSAHAGDTKNAGPKSTAPKAGSGGGCSCGSAKTAGAQRTDTKQADAKANSGGGCSCGSTTTAGTKSADAKPADAKAGNGDGCSSCGAKGSDKDAKSGSCSCGANTENGKSTGCSCGASAQASSSTATTPTK